MNQTLKVILWIVGIALLLLGIWYFRVILTYLVVSMVISIIGAPLTRWIRRIKIKNWSPPGWLAAVLVMTLFVYVISLFFSLFAPLIAEEAKIISQIDVEKTSDQLEGQLLILEDWSEQFNLSGDERSNREFLLQQLKDVVDFGYVSSFFNNIFSILGNAFIATFSILFMTFFFLKDGHLVKRILFTITPDKYLDEVKNIVTRSRSLLSRYFLGLLAQVTIITLLVTIGLSIIGVKNALIIGFLAGIVNLIPYIGPIIGICIGLFIAITTNLDMDIQSGLLPLTGKVLTVFVIVQLIDNFFTQPVILGNSVRAHPLEIFIVISLAATAFGIGGMILAIPAYTVLRIVAKEFLSRFKIVKSLTKDI